jgi:hypothetical protein
MGLVFVKIKIVENESVLIIQEWVTNTWGLSYSFVTSQAAGIAASDACLERPHPDCGGRCGILKKLVIIENPPTLDYVASHALEVTG